MANIATTKNYKVGMMRKNEDTGEYIFEEYATKKDEQNKFYNVTELLESILEQEGTSFSFKTGQEIEPDLEEF